MSRAYPVLPRILIIDDVFGRTLGDRPNEERADLCRSLLLADVTGDSSASGVQGRIARPIAEALFCRAQTPVCAGVGDTVENDLAGCLQTVRAGWQNRPADVPPWSLVLLDLCFYTGTVTSGDPGHLPGVPAGRPADDQPSSYFGLEILKALRHEFPDMPVVILSGNPRRPVSRDIDTHGARGFIGSADPNAVSILQEYLDRHGLIADESMLGYSVPLLMALRSARRLKGAARNVLIRGESGVGKELLARYVHRHTRRDEPFVIVNSGLLNPNLYSSALFGHRKGAFTGAIADKRGLIREAHGGSMFFDEVARLPPEVQAGLLRVLQERTVRPEGADDGREVSVDVQFIFATNEDIEGEVIAGGFRADLLERLPFGGGTIVLPPLRERRSDIPLLASRFFERAKNAPGGGSVRGISPEALDMLRAADWPGNVRELEGCIRKAVAEYPDVEYLYPLHFEFPAAGRLPASDVSAHATHAAPTVTPPLVTHLDDVAAFLSRFDFSQVPHAELAGALPKIQRVFQDFAARLLETALARTSRATPDAPDGRAKIHPAIKLLKGDPKLTASAAADEVKRLLTHDDVRRAGHLRDAYEVAIRLRPPTSRKPRPDADPHE